MQWSTGPDPERNVCKREEKIKLERETKGDKQKVKKGYRDAKRKNHDGLINYRNQRDENNNNK